MAQQDNADFKIAIILNGISFKKKNFYKKILPKLSVHNTIDVFETHSKNDAIILASKAVELKYKIILAAGGDGTINQVVNGILSGREQDINLPVVGIIPLGSGNDLARGIKLLENPVDKLIALLENYAPRLIDIGKVYYSDANGNISQNYFINVADVGMGPEVVKRVIDNSRTFGSAFDYYKNILLTFSSYKTMQIHASAPLWQWKGKVRSLALANGKYYGHGLCIAPDAKPNDDIFTAFICGNVSVFDFIRYTGKLKNGKKINHPEVHYYETKSITLESEGRCLIEADGELLGELPATIEMTSAKLYFLY